MWDPRVSWVKRKKGSGGLVYWAERGKGRLGLAQEARLGFSDRLDPRLVGPARFAGSGHGPSAPSHSLSYRLGGETRTRDRRSRPAAVSTRWASEWWQGLAWSRGTATGSRRRKGGWLRLGGRLGKVKAARCAGAQPRRGPAAVDRCGSCARARPRHRSSEHFYHGLGEVGLGRRRGVCVCEPERHSHRPACAWGVACARAPLRRGHGEVCVLVRGMCKARPCQGRSLWARPAGI